MQQLQGYCVYKSDNCYSSLTALLSLTYIKTQLEATTFQTSATPVMTAL